MAEIAANSVAVSPVITSSHSFLNGSYGFDLDAGNYATIQTDDYPCWLKIDFGSNYYISQIRTQAGPDQSGTHSMGLYVSTDNVNWDTVLEWSGQTYYSSLTPWQTVNKNVRYIKIQRNNQNNHVRVFYTGVELGTNTYDKDISGGVNLKEIIITNQPILEESVALSGLFLSNQETITEETGLGANIVSQSLCGTLDEAVALHTTFTPQMLQHTITNGVALNDTIVPQMLQHSLTEQVVFNDSWVASIKNSVWRKRRRIA